MPVNRQQGRVNALDRQLKALELRKAGASYRAIAAQLGYSLTGAYKAVDKALTATLSEAAEPLRTLELERLDAMQVALWPQARQGNQGAVDRILRIMERRAKLLGLDAPTQVDQVQHIRVEFDDSFAETDAPAE